MPDAFRAADLTDDHLGCYIRTRDHEGRLRAIARAGDSHVQLLLVDGDGPFLPAVPVGEPVHITPDP